MKVGRKSAWDTKIKPRLEEIKGWCRDGLIDTQIAELLGVDKSTFWKYKAEKTELLEALKITKQIADLRVENSLYQRAIGCETTEIIEDTVYRVGDDGRARPIGDVKRRKIVKQIPPDTRACEKWIYNRMPDKWRDQYNIEVTGKDGGPIETAQLSKSEYKKVREKMLKDDDC